MIFDNTKPPPAPPNRTGLMGFGGWVETEESKERGAEYREALRNYEYEPEKMKC